MRKSIVMGLGLALSIAGTAMAQQNAPDAPRPSRGERGDQMRGPRRGPDGFLLKDITLTEGQRTQIAQLRKTQRDKMETGREKNREQFEALRQARQRGDTAAVRKAFEQRRQVMEQERAQHLAAIRNILTAEQRVQFDKNVAELKQREAQRGERRFGKRGGKRGPGAKRDSASAKPTRFGR